MFFSQRLKYILERYHAPAMENLSNRFQHVLSGKRSLRRLKECFLSRLLRDHQGNMPIEVNNFDQSKRRKFRSALRIDVIEKPGQERELHYQPERERLGTVWSPMRSAVMESDITSMVADPAPNSTAAPYTRSPIWSSSNTQQEKAITSSRPRKQVIQTNQKGAKIGYHFLSSDVMYASVMSCTVVL